MTAVKLPNGLTEKEEAFTRFVGQQGLNQSEAYRRSYDAENSKPETINEEACRLAALPHISARIDVLRTRRLAVADADADYVLAGLKKQAEGAKEASAQIRALELLGKAQTGGSLFVDRISEEEPASEAQLKRDLAEAQAQVEGIQAQNVVSLPVKRVADEKEGN